MLSGQAPPTQRALEESLRQWALTGRVVLCVADIDDFKRYNDVKGYPAGDGLIGRLAAALMESAPRTSLVVHRSGDEFYLLAPQARPGEVIADAMDVRDRIERVAREGADVEPPPGFSMGVAVCEAPMAYAELERNLSGARFGLDVAQTKIASLSRERQSLSRSIEEHEAPLEAARRTVDELDRPLMRQRHRVELDGARRQLDWVPRAIEGERAKLEQLEGEERDARLSG